MFKAFAMHFFVFFYILHIQLAVSEKAWSNIFFTNSEAATGGVSVKKGVLRSFAKFTGKHLCHSLFFIKVAVKNSLWQHFRTSASTISETCFEFQIGEESAIRSINKADVRFERENLFERFIATTHVYFQQNSYVLLWWFPLGMYLIHFNPMFHLGRKQFFHSICLKWIEAPYLKWRKSL